MTNVKMIVVEDIVLSPDKPQRVLEVYKNLHPVMAHCFPSEEKALAHIHRRIQDWGTCTVSQTKIDGWYGYTQWDVKAGNGDTMTIRMMIDREEISRILDKKSEAAA